MSEVKDLKSKGDKDFYTDKEINEVAEWFQDLTLRQLFFLKKSYEGFLTHEAQTMGSNYVQ